MSVFHTRYSKEIHCCGSPVIIIACITEVILQLYPNMHLIFQFMLQPNRIKNKPSGFSASELLSYHSGYFIFDKRSIALRGDFF